MSANSKGNALEIEARDILLADGWNVFRQHRKPMFIKGRMVTVGADIFGCDIVAKRRHSRPLWVQVSTPSNKSAKIRQVMEHPWNFDCEDVQIWIRQKGVRAFRVYVAPDFEESTPRFCIAREKRISG